jgi:hypothetical protein
VGYVRNLGTRREEDKSTKGIMERNKEGERLRQEFNLWPVGQMWPMAFLHMASLIFQ